VPSPTLAAFDAQNREVCVAKRPRTNTAQQALVLMNDLTFVEAARVLAARVLSDADADNDRMRLLYQLAVGRMPTTMELPVLNNLLADLSAEYRDDPKLAEQLSASGDSTVDQTLDARELAAWTAVANTILSLDEVISRN